MMEQDDALLDVSYNELWNLPEMCPTPVISHKERSIIHGVGKQHSFPLYKLLLINPPKDVFWFLNTPTFSSCRRTGIEEVSLMLL